MEPYRLTARVLQQVVGAKKREFPGAVQCRTSVLLESEARVPTARRRAERAALSRTRQQYPDRAQRLPADE
jgi:hypothetical protein